MTEFSAPTSRPLVAVCEGVLLGCCGRRFGQFEKQVSNVGSGWGGSGVRSHFELGDVGMAGGTVVN